jgi:hypothetical protein
MKNANNGADLAEILKDFRVRSGERVKLRDRPTIVKPFCKSKKAFQ